MNQNLDVIGILIKLKVILRRRLDLLILPVFLLLPCAYIAFTVAPKQYRATTKLHITQLEGLVSNKRSAPREQRQRIELLIVTMKSHKILSQLATRIRNHERIQQKQTPIKTPPQTRAEMIAHELRVVSLRQRVRIFYLGHGLVQLSFSCAKPKRCLDNINTLLQLFMAETLRPHQESIRRAAQFLEKQLTWMKSKLEEKERRLTTFKQKFNLDRPKTFQILSQTYLYLKKNLNQLEIKNAAQKKRVALLHSKLQFLNPALIKTRNRILRLLRLQVRFARLRSRYTFKHPEVIQTRKQYRSLLTALKEPGRFSPRSLDAIMRSMRWKSGKSKNNDSKGLFEQYQDASLRQSTLQRRILANQKQLKQLERRLAVYPAHEQTLRKLRRDADTSQATYLKLIALYQKTLLQRELEVFDASRRVQVIEPARLPLFPEAPKKKLFLAGGLMAAIAISVLLIAFAELFYPSLQGPEETAALLGVEVLGEVNELAELEL